jgi:hypothetical protein
VRRKIHERLIRKYCSRFIVQSSGLKVSYQILLEPGTCSLEPATPCMNAASAYPHSQVIAPAQGNAMAI